MSNYAPPLNAWLATPPVGIIRPTDLADDWAEVECPDGRSFEDARLVQVGGWIGSSGVQEAIDRGSGRTYQTEDVWNRMRVVMARFEQVRGADGNTSMVRDSTGRPIVELVVTPWRHGDGTRDLTSPSMDGWRIESDWHQVCFLPFYRTTEASRGRPERPATLQETWTMVVEAVLTMWQDEEDEFLGEQEESK